MDPFELGTIVVFVLAMAYINMKNEKLKRRIDDNKELIKDLYRIDDERILNDK